MGYRKIANLYSKADFIFCYALEKIEGTSAHISYDNNQLHFFSGGADQYTFESLFDKADLLNKFKDFSESITPVDSEAKKITVYGEAFGGKMQGMSRIYGPNLRFMAFEVQIGDKWCNVPYAEEIVKNLGLEFVPYEKGPLSIEWLDSQRDRSSLVAVIPDAPREGIVIRQIYEDQLINGGRHIYKHKRPEFRETRTPREVDPERVQVLANAQEVADEYVVEERLQHVLDKNPYNGPEDTGKIIRAMIADIQVEEGQDIVWSKEVEKAISRKTAQMLHNPGIKHD